jgi:hypothetical protein
MVGARTQAAPSFVNLSSGKFLVEVRFVIRRCHKIAYVSVYRQHVSSRWYGLLLAILYKRKISVMFPGVRGEGRFESRVASRRTASQCARFWNPHLVMLALSRRGRTVLQEVTDCRVIQ